MAIKEEINKLIDAGMKDKQEIYTKVVKELGIPRPTVRRTAREMRLELTQKIRILSGEDFCAELGV